MFTGPKRILFLSWAILLFCPFLSPADMGSEIDHLLQYIEASDCTFVRNGKSYVSSDAVDHIRRKYSHIKGRIKTTEDFIRHAAAKSSVSGQPYQVICGDDTIPTAEWLTRELARFRKAGN